MPPYPLEGLLTAFFLTVSNQISFLKASCGPLALLSLEAERDGTVRSKTAARWSFSGFEPLVFPSCHIRIPRFHAGGNARLNEP